MTDVLFTAPFVVTQGGADTSAEVTIATGLLPGIDLTAWELVMIELQMNAALVKTWAAADSHMTIQATKRSLAAGYATLNYSDTDLITQFQVASAAEGTPANQIFFPTSYWFELPPGALIYAPAMYIQCMSTATGATNSVWGRVMYRPFKLSQSEALAVVASRP